MPAKRNSRSEQGSKRAPNARTRRSAERAAKHAQGRAQADDRLRQLAGKMAKVQRWRASQDVWTAFMRDRTPDASTPLAAPTFPAQPAAAPPAPASSPAPALVIAARASLDASMLPDSRGWKRDALARIPPPAAAPLSPPPAESRKKVRGGLQAALAAAAPPAAAPQPRTATSEAAPDRRAASPRSPTLPPPPSTSPPSAFWPALPTRASPGPETNVPAWKRECRPPQG